MNAPCKSPVAASGSVEGLGEVIMLRALYLVICVAILCCGMQAQAGDSTYRFHVSVKNHINDNAQFPPSFTQTGTSPIGDVISGRLNATMNVDPAALALLVNVNRPTREDDLAGYAVGITFNESQGAGIDLAPKPVGNIDSLSGTAGKDGKINANFQGKLIANGKKFKLYASNLNLQEILSIPSPTVAGLTGGNAQIRIKVEGKGLDPETGNQIKVTLVDEIVNFTYTISTRLDTADADGDGDTTEVSFSMATGKGTGKPTPKN